jgi:hypothetical protein
VAKERWAVLMAWASASFGNTELNSVYRSPSQPGRSDHSLLIPTTVLKATLFWDLVAISRRNFTTVGLYRM